MSWLPFAVGYAAVAVFIVAVIARIVMWKKMPMHVRWELYPVAHEGKRAHYGGSYLEEVDWWKKPREASLWGELKVMVPEILFLVALKEHNPKLWVRSFPFHFGIYLVIACTMLMIGGGVLAALAPGAMAGGLGSVVRAGVVICGFAGLALGIFGALGLLQRRLTAPELKDFTAPADIFNLVFFVVAFGVALLHGLAIDRDFARAMGFVYGLVTFQTAGGSALDPLTLASAVLLAVLVAYIPLTHMSHFIGKYFAYHAIRWDDTPNLRGGAREKPIQQVLGYPVSWAAPHIQGNGKKTWADVATEEQKK